MNKQEFLTALERGLAGLPQEDIRRSVDFYSEMIDDRMDDGASQEEAVAAIGSLEEILGQLCPEPPKAKPRRRMKAWEIVLLVIGSPVWASLLVAAMCAGAAVYIALWAVLVSLYAVGAACAGCGVGGTILALLYLSAGNTAGAVFSVGASLLCWGVAILLFLGLKQTTKGFVFVTKKLFLWVRSRLTGKGDAQ